MTRISIRLPEELKELADERARERGVSLDDLVRDALQNDLQLQPWPKTLYGKTIIDPHTAPCPFPHPEPDL